MAIGASWPKQKDIILMTGATGALGSELLPLMLRKGYDTVCLVRASDTTAAQRRIDAITGSGHPNLRIVRGDITKSQCGIADADLRQLHEWRVTKIFHCAASINFQDRDTAYSTNVNGVKNVIDLADTLGVRNIIHVSTAYVAGEAKLLREADVPQGARFHPRNVYEATKQIGECRIRKWAESGEDRHYVIYRPSILVGRLDGSSPTFSGYYSYFQALHNVAEAIRERATRRSNAPNDIGAHSRGGPVTLPLTLQASEVATLNLIPIDWVTATMLMLMDLSRPNSVVHLVHPSPRAVRWVIAASLNILKISGVNIVRTLEEKQRDRERQSPLLKRLQRKVDTIVDQYHPYTNHEVDFHMDAARQLLREQYRRPPVIDEQFLARILTYAVRLNWGKTSDDYIMAASPQDG